MRAPTLALTALLVTAALAGCMDQTGSLEEDAPSGSVDATGTIPTVPEPHADVACVIPEASPEAASNGSLVNPRVTFETSKGTFTAELYLEQAPVTACNFAKLVRAGFYDGTKFHRIIENFMIQGGDPNTRDGPESTWGTGGPAHRIPDEFHPALRHNTEGLLSMANSGPNTGGSQFFITTGKPTHLDDRHSVFGKVVEGMEVVYAINGVETNSADRPTTPVILTKATLVADETPEPATHGVGVHPILDAKTTAPARHTSFAVVLKNTGNVRDTVSLDIEAPAGWTTKAAGPAEGLVVRAGAGQVTFATVTPPATATAGTYEVTLVARSSHDGVPEARATVNVTVGALGANVTDGTKVVANYAGVTPDGRLFDTSIERVAKNPDQPKFGQIRQSGFDTFEFTVGAGVIPGFTNLAKTSQVGETVTAWIPAKDAYGQSRDPYTGQSHRLAPFDLVFELEIVSTK